MVGARPPTRRPPAGCWCPEGLVLDGERGCVRPRECRCEVEGLRYWPGQRVKLNCRLCTCLDGQPRRCRQNPACTGAPCAAPHLGEGAETPFSPPHLCPQ